MAETKNLYGVDSIKTVLNFLATATKATFEIDSNKDGQVDAAEKVAYASKLLPGALTLLPAIPNLDEEAGDITDAEFDDLVAHAQRLDFLPVEKDHVEVFVKNTITWINYNRKFTLYAISFFKGGETPAPELPASKA